MDDGVDVVKMLQETFQVLHTNANIDAYELKINLEQSLQDDGPSNLVNQVQKLLWMNGHYQRQYCPFIRGLRNQSL
jgi:hypothetical protein